MIGIHLEQTNHIERSSVIVVKLGNKRWKMVVKRAGVKNYVLRLPLLKEVEGINFHECFHQVISG